MDNQNKTELIDNFLSGHNPMKRIISIECGYDENCVSIIYKNDKNEKRIKMVDFKPFVWAKNSVAVRMFDGDRKLLKKNMIEYGIGVRALKTSIDGSEPSDRLENGYKYVFYAKQRMSYQRFLSFFQAAKTPIYENKKKQIADEKIVSSREFLAVTPVEQFMIASGCRLFKGYNNYDDLKRMQFDLETQGLNPEIHAIDQIGIRTNKGFEKIISITGEGDDRKINELSAIIEFLSIIADEKPDVIAGHNSENFDWNFIIVRCQKLGTTLEDLSLKFFKHPIFKKNKESVLKLGGEVEYYKPTIMWGHNIVDSLHAVRRAQAIDSSMKLANLKYVTKYLKLKKENRVYVPGGKIGTIWLETDKSYAFNNKNGDWYKITENRPLLDGYDLTSGRYIVERYLLDDIWETDKVELKLNESNFLIGKMLPTTFQRACTMGTAGIWKLILLAWCYENDLAAPSFGKSRRFTGGLSRLLKVGYADRVVKLDYNSLYPSIILTWNIGSKLDISNSMLMMLEYVLSQREKYKGLKAEAGGKAKDLKKKLETFEGSEEEKEKLFHEMRYWESEAAANDKKQLPLKILANSFFGSFGAPDVFPMGDVVCAEKTTCIGRQSLRLMIGHFTNLGYTPIVGDTDGFNFQMPLEFRYTKEKPYISPGLGRNTIKGKSYDGVEADVAEFEDIYLNHPFNGGVNKMGLGIDEFCPATINFSRKNYADMLENGSTKKVGNTIKSRRMSGYIEKFLDGGIDMLLEGKGQDFIESYYSYIDKIYNYQIPLKDIASKGKIKKTVEQYIADCKTLTKSGSKKSRQAWYELVIKNNVKVELNDTIYYINTGSKKSESDVKRITHQYTKIDGELVEITNSIKKELLKKATGKDEIVMKDFKAKEIKELIKPYIEKEEDEIILNCELVPNSIVESEEDILCNEDIEYNVVKYIEQFNNRIKPLLVCFSLDIRDKIMITNPADRQYFTEEQCKLVSGFPNKESDQDTFEALMSLERKEIEYWVSIDEKPPFVDECGMDWDNILKDYFELVKKEKTELFKEENDKYIEAINNLTLADVEAFEESGTIPASLTKIVTLDNDMHFKFINIPDMKPSTGGYIFDDITYQDKSESEFENFVNSNAE